MSDDTQGFLYFLVRSLFPPSFPLPTLPILATTAFSPRLPDGLPISLSTPVQSLAFSSNSISSTPSNSTALHSPQIQSQTCFADELRSPSVVPGVLLLVSVHLSATGSRSLAPGMLILVPSFLDISSSFHQLPPALHCTSAHHLLVRILHLLDRLIIWSQLGPYEVLTERPHDRAHFLGDPSAVRLHPCRRGKISPQTPSSRTMPKLPVPRPSSFTGSRRLSPRTAIFGFLDLHL